jgi:predicted ATPase
LQQCCRDVRRVVEHTDTLLALTHAYHLSYFHHIGSCLRGWALVQQGAMADGLAQLRDEARSWVATQGITGQSYVLACLAEAYGQAGQPLAGLRVVAEALAAVATHGERWNAAKLHRLQGELVLQQAQLQPGSDAMGTAYATAARHFQQARTLAQLQQARFWELRAALSLSRLWQWQGKRAEACALLTPIYDWFTEGFDTADLQEAKARLEELA